MASNHELRSNGGAYDHLLSAEEQDGGTHSDASPYEAPTEHVSEAARQRYETDHQKEVGRPHIVFRDVSKHYDASSGPVEALRNIDLTIRQGEIFGIIGRSGAGKSSLIRTINRLENINSGEIEIDNANINTLKSARLIKLRQRIGMIFQHFNLLRSKTVFENLALPARAAGLSASSIKTRVDELLALVGLEGKADVYPARLSGGQKQRVGIARALMLEPEILLCDEATSALDPITTRSILDLLRDINQRLGLTIVLITHEMSVIRAVCDRVAVLDQGELREEGPIWRVFGTPQDSVTQTLLAPLQVTLPFDLQKRVQPQSDKDHVTLVLQVDVGRQHGGDADVDIFTIANVLGPQAHLLSGNIDHLQGHAQGRLLFGITPQDTVDSDTISINHIHKALSHLDISTEVLGYV